MHILRSERVAALLLITAAALGILLANTPLGPGLVALKSAHPGWPVFDLSLGHWVTDGLLAIFFFLAAIELKHELTHGELDSPRKALVPAVAAVGGVVTPAVVYLAVVQGGSLASGWPIPTATDIAFALGVLALVGRRMPSRVRALLLALAVIDDLIAIVIIAVFFTAGLALVPLLAAIPVVALFGWLSTRAGRGRPLVTVALIILGVAAWALVALSGIHPTIAGVALGLAMAGRPAHATRHALEPVSNGVILPIFAFVAALVIIPSGGTSVFGRLFWAIAIALPLGKLVGIVGGAVLAQRLGRVRNGVALGDLVAVAGLGGIGFTVSLLMNELAWKGDGAEVTEGTVAVLVASVVAAVIGGALTIWRGRRSSRS
ncbi:Na+/H+ antiporter NhaA [Galbitalea soli]|uniref:Na(+)/H(+) antiporter NhaA n=1 Tax=Galbitalea soli TaxID=1268042 RepID=A0A7C9PLT1_9MICO|nr:Na+/H+ antiporter NhaA [Galbitalea soli]NEM90248.1 Na+/H+ antiporter NhaA [Galbitalea soli]NYJ30956.1 NhaA family Na+:H+ antiporter [Galbitalea soli]